MKPPLDPTRAGRRRGMAPVELLVFLPILSLVLLCIASLVVAVYARIGVLERARHEAWLRRHAVAPPPCLDFAADPSLGLVADQPLQRGRIEVTRERRITVPPFLAREPLRVQLSHVVLGGSWDHRAITFRPHGRLQLDPRALVFYSGTLPRIDFGALVGFASPAGRGRRP